MGLISERLHDQPYESKLAALRAHHARRMLKVVQEWLASPDSIASCQPERLLRVSDEERRATATLDVAESVPEWVMRSHWAFWED